jgi:hypothetical protein
MAGTIIVDTINSSVASTPPVFQANGTEVGTLCRAWVNFNGTGTVAIRASFNVSSITDNGTGDYTVNFTNAMPDANYSLAGACSFAPTSTSSAPVVDIHTLATGSARIVTTRYTDNVIDLSTVAVSIFR